MNVLSNFVIVVQVISALAIIALVLLQHGKGADMGAAFGSGASGSLFGASGSSNFLSKSTAVAAAIFFASTLSLAYMGSTRSGDAAPSGGVMERMAAPANGVPANAAPVVPGTTPTTDVPAPTAGVPAAPAQTVPAAPAPAPVAPAPSAPAPAAPATQQ
ncbi:preprotein translocase subunit SecG [Massilia niabensis]|uniref:Protein-export membrane protein SecG n=1 Tax=Massilia niabensis TaxID=544910 RepID=A0ABW0L924_9BURK